MDVVVALDRGDGVAQRGFGGGHRVGGHRPHVDAQDRLIGDDVVGAATIDLRRIDLEVGRFQRVETQREVGGGDKRVATLLGVPPGVRRTPVDQHRKIAAARPRAGERAVGQRGFVGERRSLAARQLGDQRGGGMAARFLVAVDHHVIADTLGQRRRLERRQRGEDDRDAALHVGGAGAVEHARFQPFERLERMIGGEHRVHMTGQQQLDRRVGAHAKVEMRAALNRLDAARGIDAFDGVGRDEAHGAGERRKGVGEQAGDGLEPGKIAGAAVDRGPAFDLRQHRRIGRTLQRGGFAWLQDGHAQPIAARARLWHPRRETIFHAIR